MRRPLMEHRLWHAANHPLQQGPRTVEEPSSVPPPSGTCAWQEDVDWHAWFRNLGRQTRTLRELLGLSQDRLALLAGVSQGPGSRFRRGVAPGTAAVVLFQAARTLPRRG